MVTPSPESLLVVVQHLPETTIAHAHPRPSLGVRLRQEALAVAVGPSEEVRHVVHVATATAEAEGGKAGTST